MTIFEKRESRVRSYCRTFNAVFTHAEGAVMKAEDGRSFIDFFAGAGTMNYGHNPPKMRDALTAYIVDGGIVHTLDMHTAAKRTFLERFEEVILEPRNLDYKVMFPGPTGTNAVEAALKLARKVTGRTNIVSFTNGFHGMTLGSLAVTGNSAKRRGGGVPSSHAVSMPFDGYLGEDVDTLDVVRRYLEDTSSGLDKPAAFIVETAQGEGGVNFASPGWLRGLADLAKAHDVLLIVDDIQAGCGRTGTFFSFEDAGIVPDIVTLSKSLSGFGLPLAVTLLRPQHDVFNPGEHNGTFRGHNPAFVTATAALDFWKNQNLSRDITIKANLVRRRLHRMAEQYAHLKPEVRGKGLLWGISFADSELAGKLSAHAFGKGLVIETSGNRDQVLKIMPPLTIEREMLEAGLDIIAESLYDLAGAGVEAHAAEGALVDV